MKRLALAAVAGALGFPGVASAARLPLILPLKANDAGLQSFATAVSTPGSPRYGQYESLSTLARRFGASAATQAAAVRYLRADGATGVAVSPTGMYVQATMNATHARRTLARTDRLPPGVLGVVGLNTSPVVHPVDTSAPPSGYLPATGTPSGCPGALGTGGFTPTQYLTAYGYTPLRDAGLKGHGQRIALIEIDGYKPSDLETFARCFSLALPPIHAYGVGTAHALAPGPEATLDLEVLDAVAPRAASFEVFESGNDAVAVDEAFAAPLLTAGTKPQVITASIGLCEQALDAAFGSAGILAVERNLELAAATGITMVTAAGDTGAADCSDNEGDVLDGLAVDYPSSSPWVTAVGGTNVHLNSANQIVSQQVWNDTSAQLGAGGGGLSQLFYRPAYQNGVVGPDSRAVPDLSMLSDVAPGYAVFCTAAVPGCQGWASVGGTSAAAPLVGGGVALIDQALTAHGREQIGMANPLLYSIGRSAAGASVFSDVTQGSNDVGPWIPGGTGQPLGCCTATPGFDEASGWGSLDLAALAQRALTMLPKSGVASISIPKSQQPVSAGRLSFRLGCTKGCRSYAFGFAAIAGEATIDLRSATYRFKRAGSQVQAIRFTGAQESRLRAAEAAHKRIEFELYGGALNATGTLGNVSPGSELVII